MYRYIIRPLLFLFPPETIHEISVIFLKFIGKIPFLRFIIKKYFIVKSSFLNRTIAGLTFRNPVGLAAGFDKNAEIFGSLSDFGFGFIEIGTVTPKAQRGNPKPRVFRLKKDNALINRMGFNNQGAEDVIEKLKKRVYGDLIIGGNIGKNKTTPLDNAISDYKYCFEKLFPYVDYFTINVSSPNTPELRKLQEKQKLEELFTSLIKLNNSMHKQKPIFIKIAPDLSNAELRDIADLVNNCDIAGVIATNTTIGRENLSYDLEFIKSLGEGGLSGKPVSERSTEIIVEMRKYLNKEKFIIGVGGIMSERDALKKLEAGADLLQLYTGFIYEGPSLVKKINRALIVNKVQ
jgi:dihydroorotate dehydrogenase